VVRRENGKGTHPCRLPNYDAAVSQFIALAPKANAGFLR